MTEIDNNSSSDDAVTIVAALHEYLGAGGHAAVVFDARSCSFAIRSPEILQAILHGRCDGAWPPALYAQVEANLERSVAAREAARQLRQVVRFRRWRAEQAKIESAKQQP